MKRVFVLVQLTLDGTQLQVAFAQVPQFEQLLRDTQFLRALNRLGVFVRIFHVGGLLLFRAGVVGIIVVVIHAVDTIRVGSLRLFGRRVPVIVVSQVHHFLDVLVLLFEAQQLLLQVVDGPVEVVGAVVQHAHPLVAAGLVIEDYNDHVPINFLALIRVVFKNLLCPFEALKSALIFFIFE